MDYKRAIVIIVCTAMALLTAYGIFYQYQITSRIAMERGYTEKGLEELLKKQRR